MKVHKSKSNDRETAQALVETLQVLLLKERELLKTAEEANDEGTTDMITPFIAEQEKMVWMLRAWLG